MKVRIRLFAVLRELAGSDWIELDLREGATVADALKQLGDQPALAGALQRMAIQMAVNHDYASASTELDDEDELALIPPLSGGAPDGGAHVRLTEQRLSPEALSSLVANPQAGAIVVFQGVTREVSSLDYEAYAEMAERRLALIMADCIERHRLLGAALEHRIGTVPLGEPSVIVAVSAAHRDEAFAGAREAIDRVKSEAPIWKRELEQDGSRRWVQGTPAPGAIKPGGETE
jgi:MoaE-MoaD fusion protein